MTLKSWAIQRSSISSRTFYEIEALVPNCYDHGGTCGASYSLCLQNECPVPCLLILIKQVASIGLSTNGAAEKPNTLTTKLVTEAAEATEACPCTSVFQNAHPCIWLVKLKSHFWVGSTWESRTCSFYSPSPHIIGIYTRRKWILNANSLYLANRFIPSWEYIVIQ